ncbi:glycosyl transferase, group 1 family protein [Chitinispirillum alkaliphilum]|nr:glycosyl transferase, group 1 family protein [Chitinispirillum alkaliphilum]
MRIITVSSSDINGGAARAAYRLHRSLVTSGIESRMLVQNKSSDDYTVTGPQTVLKKCVAYARSAIGNLPVKLYRNKTSTPYSSSLLGFSNIVEKINRLSPDIVHLHWICGEMLPVQDVARINAPVIWSLHDMWAFTGGCHYDVGCGLFVKGCGNCKVLGSNKENDLSRSSYKRKRKAYSKINNLTIIGLSRWLTECAIKSALLRNVKIINLPNPIDCSVFKKADKRFSRSLWNLPSDKKLVLFGAMGATSDNRKGYKELSEAIAKLEDKTAELVVFGSGKPRTQPNFGFKTHYLGCLNDEPSLVTLYSAVDVMVVPSLQENLSNAIMESLSCGTPVVAFNIGGNGDMIVHKQNGYLAKPFNTTDLKDGIQWVLNAPNYDELCKNAREKVLREFDSNVVAQKYIALYKEILNKEDGKV